MKSCRRATGRKVSNAFHKLEQIDSPGGSSSLDIEACKNLLRQCEQSKDLSRVRKLHSYVSSTPSLRSSGFLENGFIRAYGKCGSVKDARETFDTMPRKNDFSWGTMLAAYAQNGHYRDTLDLFKRMDLEPNAVVYTTVVGACSCLEDLEQGRDIHKRILSAKRLKRDVLMENALLSMYARCGSVEDAKRLFEGMASKTVVTWNAMIAAYAHNSRYEEAIQLYRRMDVEPSDVTLTSVLAACSTLGLLEQGKEIHAVILSREKPPDLALQNALLSMYAKCKCLDEAADIFHKLTVKDVVSWSAMIGAFSETEHSQEAIELYSKMHLEGVRPNHYTFASALQACANVGALKAGKSIHEQILKNGYELNLVLGTALVDLYASYGNLDEAKSLFDWLEGKDEPLWTLLIAGYAKQGHRIGVLQLYRELKTCCNFPVNRMIYCSVISACSNVGAFTEGKSVHEQIKADGLETDYILATSLVSMYCRWGSLEDARRVFDRVSGRDTLTWTTLITGYAKHGEYTVALELYKEMELEGAEPGEFTFTAVLYACSHAGLQEQGREYFISIGEDYGMEQTLTHYSCIVDLLSRSGRLTDAEQLIKHMPVEPSDVTWTSLLGASRIHKDVKRASYAAGQISKMDPVDPASYILLSNVHAVTGDYSGMVDVRNTMVARGVKKRRGCSFIEVDGRIHEFSIGDDMHPRYEEIQRELKRLAGLLKEAGYVPESEEVLHDVGEHEKELLLQLHSEKVAIAFGMISTSPGTTLRIFNTMRICYDCHAAAKLISGVVQREIVIRDSNRFHKFVDGQCTCGDYW